MKSKTIWVAGEAFTHLDKWMIIGVFDSEKKAVAACYNIHCFVGPLELNHATGPEIESWKGGYYPHVDNHKS